MSHPKSRSSPIIEAITSMVHFQVAIILISWLIVFSSVVLKTNCAENI